MLQRLPLQRFLSIKLEVRLERLLECNVEAVFGMRDSKIGAGLGKIAGSPMTVWSVFMLGIHSLGGVVGSIGQQTWSREQLTSRYTR